ncbi:hypothetical protein RHIZ404_230273 [Rhizobium sp. EC-SD404]|nr:hypothetical protein RHIZ404_230273 [Rhizobium sp. EC-SD404]
MSPGSKRGERSTVYRFEREFGDRSGQIPSINNLHNQFLFARSHGAVAFSSLSQGAVSPRE